MNDVIPRFEFRTFAPCLGMVDQRLRAMADCAEISESREIYLLGRDGVRDSNSKLRRGRLELKRIIERRHDLETNELSKRLDKLAERVGPHSSTLLIIVVVVMDFMAQVQAHVMSHQYEGLMKKANLKGIGGTGMPR